MDIAEHLPLNLKSDVKKAESEKWREKYLLGRGLRRV